MDDFEHYLIRSVIDHVYMDTDLMYAKATGFREALERYAGSERARELLFAAGHEY